MQLDRIDNNKNYEPGNVRWATPKQNVRNRSVTLWMEYKGEIMPLAEVAELVGLNRSTLRARVLRNDPNPFRKPDQEKNSHAR
jgi:hypothetical protein